MHFYDKLQCELEAQKPEVVQTNNKWCSFELNSLFEKSYKIDIDIKLTIEFKCIPLIVCLYLSLSCASIWKPELEAWASNAAQLKASLCSLLVVIITLNYS
jgi:hypothetical protein